MIQLVTTRLPPSLSIVPHSTNLRGSFNNAIYSLKIHTYVIHTYKIRPIASSPDPHYMPLTVCQSCLYPDVSAFKCMGWINNGSAIYAADKMLKEFQFMKCHTSLKIHLFAFTTGSSPPISVTLAMNAYGQGLDQDKQKMWNLVILADYCCQTHS